MRFSIITLFPQMLQPTFELSILGRAQKKDLIQVEYIDLRPFGLGRHQVVDGKPYGGGVGMLLRPDSLAKAIQSIQISPKAKVLRILTSASGKKYDQKYAKQLLSYDHIIIVCGHYEGIDQRFIDQYIDLELSIGDFVLTGGEIPAMAIVDSISRLIPGVLEKPAAVENESFENELLENPQYTRPAVFEGLEVPEVLKSGHHTKIEDWKQELQQKKTEQNRPDMLKKDQ